MIVSPKPITFESAHTLPSEPRNHGHTYRVKVWVEGPIVQEFGWVIDFAELLRIVWEAAAPLDQTTLNDTIDIPTAENVATWIAERIAVELPAGVQLIKLRLTEGVHDVVWTRPC